MFSPVKLSSRNPLQHLNLPAHSSTFNKVIVESPVLSKYWIVARIKSDANVHIAIAFIIFLGNKVTKLAVAASNGMRNGCP